MHYVHRFRVTVIFLGSKGRETEVVLLLAAVQAGGWGWVIVEHEVWGRLRRWNEFLFGKKLVLAIEEVCFTACDKDV